MKKVKKFAAAAAALALAVTMATASLTMTAFAAPDNVTLSVSNTTTHTFKAYQIFVGTFETADELLVNEDLDLGSDVNADAFYTALGLTATDRTPVKALEALKGKTDAQVLAVLKTDGVLDDTDAEELSSASASTVTETGYYYILETEGTGADAITADILLRLTVDTEITPKAGAPKVEKKVKEDDREVTLGTVMNENLYEEGYNDAADYCIGEAVPFEVVGSLPENFASYENGYYYEFIDRLGKGFVAPAQTDVKVFLDDVDITDYATITVTSASTSNPTTISVKFNNIKELNGITKDSKIVVRYNAVLDTDAVIGAVGNTNGVFLRYTNDASYDGQGYSDTPQGEEEKEDETEDTPWDGVVVFTYTIDTTKIDKDTGDLLENAKFKLLNAAKDKAAIITDCKFAGWAADVAGGTEITTAADGKFTVVGLDSAETYYIRETEAPDGYNGLEDDIAVTLTATLNSNGTWNYAEDNGTTAYTSLAVNNPYAVTAATETAVAGADGIASGNVENAQGVQLPETGGVGTTIFYIGGGALAATAGIVLIARKRAKKED